MGEPIKLIPFLERVVERNTQYHREDFQLDAQRLRAAAKRCLMDERTFYFMSRPSGTWCVLERDAFLRDSDGYKIWTHYADMSEGIEAYRVTITGSHKDIPLGTVIKFDYREQVRRVMEHALPVVEVELTFYSQEKITIPLEKYLATKEDIFFDYGAIQNFRNLPESEAALTQIISMEHRFQKGWRLRQKQPHPSPAR